MVFICIFLTALNSIGYSNGEKFPKPIKTHQAKDHIGLDVKIQFYVFSTARNSYGDYIELNSDQSWDHPRNVMVRIPPSFQKKMANLGIYNVEDHFSGRKIEIAGVLQMMSYPKEVRVPAIYLTSLDQIKVLRAKEYEYKAEDYETVSVMDFEIKVSPDIKKDVPEKGDKMVELLKEKLHDVKKVLPEAAYEEIADAKIWVNKDAMKLGLCYHGNAGYLGKVGIPLYYHQCVEVQNLNSGYNWLQHPQPWAILHELAHKYHFEVLEENNELIIETYKAAVEAGIYKKVKHIDGKEQVAYALMNHKEYFAECSESYFGVNDFYPFNRDELKKHDPKGYAMVEQCWGIKP